MGQVVATASPPWAITPEKVAEVVKRLSAEPALSRLILFGSAATAGLDQANDLDLLVVERDMGSRYHEMLRLRGLLKDLLMPIDLVVTTEETYHQRSQIAGTLEHNAHLHGRVLHDAR